MAKGDVRNERIEFVDATTDAHIIQLTSYPSPSVTLFYANTNFTPDSRTLMLLCQRSASRDAPWDLWSVRSDGSELRQMTDQPGAGGFVIQPAGDRVLFHRSGALWQICMDSLEETCLCEIGSDQPCGLAFVSPDGRYYFTASYTPGNAGPDGQRRPVVFRIRTDGSEVYRFEPPASEPWTLHSVSPGGHGLLAIAKTEQGKEYRLLDYEFRVLAIYTRSHDFAHCTFLGKTRELQGCGLPPDHALVRLGPGEETPRTIASGPYFWHSAATLDGEWIIADTNWPDVGLQLVHVPSGRYGPLCFPRSSQGHPQWTHPHPQFSPDGSCVLFTSDRTGIPQAYLARIPDQLREDIRSGRLTVASRRL